MKTNRTEKTSIDGAKLEAIIQAKGCSITVKKHYVQVQNPKHGERGQFVYLPITKSGLVNRADLSGFLVAMDGVEDLGDASFGNVRQQMTFVGDEATILQVFSDVLDALLLTGVREKRKAAARKPGEKAAKGWSFMAPASQPALPPASYPATDEERAELASDALVAELEA